MRRSSSRLLNLTAAFLLVASLGALPVDAATQEIRIGYVNLQRVINDSAPTRLANQRLEQEFSKRDKDLQDAGARFKSAVERFEKDAITMAESDRMKRQRELAEQERDLQRRAREFSEDYSQRRTEEMKALMERARKAIKQIAEQEKIDLVVTEAEYSSPRADLTEKVLRAVNTGTGAGK